MPTESKNLIALDAEVAITAAAAEGEKKTPAKFTATFYTGGALELNGWDQPVVIDLAGLESGNVLVANLDHDRTKRVGNFAVANDGKSLVANGTATAATAARDEVIQSAMDGYQWQASLEVHPKAIEEVKAGQEVEVNGQSFTGPLYVTRQGTLKGFGFVSHGADDNTNVTIAAIAASTKEKAMDAEVKKWIEAMGFTVDALSEDQKASLVANYEGAVKKKAAVSKLDDAIEAKQKDFDRREQIGTIALQACDARPYDIDAIKNLANEAIEGKWTVDKFRLELLEASVPPAHTVFSTRSDSRLNGRVIEAAICMAGRLKDYEKQFDDQTLQTAHDKFRHGIGLKQLLVMAAEANGYRSNGYNVDIEVQRAAFSLRGAGDRVMHASGFSTFSLPNTLANTANKFIREGWMHVDQAWSRIAAIKPVQDFKQTTTVSLTGGLIFEQLGPDGQIKHGTVGEETYTNQADTYARMFAITRKDIINDDLGALTAVPRRLGRGGALKLNDIFWTEFLNPSVANFFHANNANVSTGTGALGLTGLNEAYAVFMAQTDPDGTPLGSMPKLLVVPTALEATARQLMTSEKIKGDTDEPDANVWRGRFDVVSSPYMSNSAYTGYSSIVWYLLADPNDIPVIEVAALNGRVEPTVDTADADFNTLGIQMRGYSDVGVKVQEYRGGVRADGSAAG